jgi:hypothetical protein
MARRKESVREYALSRDVKDIRRAIEHAQGQGLSLEEIAERADVPLLVVERLKRGVGALRHQHACQLRKVLEAESAKPTVQSNTRLSNEGGIPAKPPPLLLALPSVATAQEQSVAGRRRVRQCASMPFDGLVIPLPAGERLAVEPVETAVPKATAHVLTDDGSEKARFVSVAEGLGAQESVSLVHPGWLRPAPTKRRQKTGGSPQLGEKKIKPEISLATGVSSTTKRIVHVHKRKAKPADEVPTTVPLVADTVPAAEVQAERTSSTRPPQRRGPVSKRDRVRDQLLRIGRLDAIGLQQLLGDDERRLVVFAALAGVSTHEVRRELHGGSKTWMPSRDSQRCEGVRRLIEANHIDLDTIDFDYAGRPIGLPDVDDLWLQHMQAETEAAD